MNDLDWEWNQNVEYVNMTLPNGEVVRFNRVWSNYRFTDREVELLMAGMEICIRTAYADGIRGSLDWQEYNGYEYLGFAPWDASVYTIGNAPFPLQWNGCVFTSEEQSYLRTGERLLVICTSKPTGTMYPVNVSFGFIEEDGYDSRWGIIPHFEEFDQPACEFTRETCRFLPVFGGKRLSLTEIRSVRKGESILFNGVSGHGKPYRCYLSLELDITRNRWCLQPDFL